MDFQLNLLLMLVKRKIKKANNKAVGAEFSLNIKKGIVSGEIILPNGKRESGENIEVTESQIREQLLPRIKEHIDFDTLAVVKALMMFGEKAQITAYYTKGNEKLFDTFEL